MMRVWRMSDVCLSVGYIGPKSRTERPRKTNIDTEVRSPRHTWLALKRSTCREWGILWRPPAQLVSCGKVFHLKTRVFLKLAWKSRVHIGTWHFWDKGWTISVHFNFGTNDVAFGSLHGNSAYATSVHRQYNFGTCLERYDKQRVS